jgi:hypothetical protein
MVKNLILILVVVCTIASCDSCNKEPDIDISDMDTTKTQVKISEDVINDLIQSFSSPVEMAALINDLDVPFSKDYMSPTDNADEYVTNFKKAIALGIFSSDLGYLNVYGKTSLIVNYITVIKRIADDLKVGQFFDFQTLKRLATNNENLDSLLFLSVHSFQEMDAHLRNNNRSDLSALVVTGVFIEGQYLVTQIVKDSDIKELADRIGEQKIVLPALIGILEVFLETDKNFEELVIDLKELENAYEDVEITVTQGKPETKIVDGVLRIIPNEESTVTMSEEQLNNIINITEKIRNKLIAL